MDDFKIYQKYLEYYFSLWCGLHFNFVFGKPMMM